MALGFRALGFKSLICRRVVTGSGQLLRLSCRVSKG